MQISSSLYGNHFDMTLFDFLQINKIKFKIITKKIYYNYLTNFLFIAQKLTQQGSYATSVIGPYTDLELGNML